ncbi:unannotated protein [freshwater metagenome]|uniref:Unannotated protein n=1 Tax=freshwater metagenome TaxID=449393 RepID=A0A6J7EA12_9ZZZZ|nr:DUF3891 family protein [Actinomycetota bacterium]
MFVLDQPEHFQIVLQPDHGRLAGEMAAAWADRGPRHAAVVTAARRHDDGWGVWEQSPQVDAAGRPIAVLDVDIRSHLAFSRACIAAVGEEDAYAGLLVSMHGAGIYQHRYGTDAGLVMAGAAAAPDLVAAFIAEQESAFAERAAALGVDDDLRWADYHRLQWFDRFSFAFGAREWDEPPAETFALGEFTFEPLGPWRARVSPWPFAEREVRFTLPRRRFERRAWTRAEFFEEFRAQAPEQIGIVLED